MSGSSANGVSGFHATIRLVLAVALVQGFAQISGVGDGYYASLAVISVTVGNYGNTLELGRQRLVGTVVGALVVLVAYPALGSLPLMVGLPLGMALARLLAGSLKLTVGYSVCMFVVVMGWLKHENQLDTWIPLRLFWTAVGVLIALLALRLFWPARARQQQREGLLALLLDLGEAIAAHLQRELPRMGRSANAARALPAGTAPTIPALRSTLLALREQRTDALRELGSQANQHPSALIWAALDQQSELLILVLSGLQRLRQPPWQRPELGQLAEHLAQRMAEVQQRLELWHHTLASSPLHIPAPPLPAWEPRNLTTLVSDQAAVALSLDEQQELGTRLLLLNRLERSLHDTEARWQDALIRYR